MSHGCIVVGKASVGVVREKHLYAGLDKPIAADSLASY